MVGILRAQEDYIKERITANKDPVPYELPIFTDSGSIYVWKSQPRMVRKDLPCRLDSQIRINMSAYRSQRGAQGKYGSRYVHLA